MTMILNIELDVNQITLTLKDGRKVVGRLEWSGEYTLSELLLPNIDALLKKCGVDKKDVEKVVPKITKTSGVTSSRIVQTVAKAWNAGVAYRY